MLSLRPLTRTPLRLTNIYPPCRHYTTPPPSTPPPAPALLLKLRTDLKTALKAKDTPRLAVLRALLAEITNAAKTSSPLTSDLQLLALLRKRAAASQAARLEFRAAGREDLVAAEEKQGMVLDEYAGSVETVGVGEVEGVVEEVVREMRGGGAGKVGLGEVMKRLFAVGGGLEGKAVERGVVAQVVREVLAKP
ncbi:hypothetical protein LTR08_007255 [Meristemomyces frigidus]|nr:hypothetical protein LTR08_007255 [Meristemomyces frigidus]